MLARRRQDAASCRKRFGGEAPLSSIQRHLAGVASTPKVPEVGQKQPKPTDIESQEPRIEEAKAALRQPKEGPAGDNELHGRNAGACSGSSSMPADR